MRNAVLVDVLDEVVEFRAGFGFDDGGGYAVSAEQVKGEKVVEMLAREDDAGAFALEGINNVFYILVILQ